MSYFERLPLNGETFLRQRYGKSSPETLYCKRHPSYQARRAPKADCEACRDLFSLSQRIGSALVNLAVDISKDLGVDIEVYMSFKPGFKIGTTADCISAKKLTIERR